MAVRRSVLLLAAFLGLAGLLGKWILAEWQRQPDLPVVNIATGDTTAAVELAELPAYEPPPLEQFSEALARPLFSTDRRPPADAPVAVVVEDRTLSATLHGITCDPRCVALLSAVGETAVLRVSEGDTFLGWKVQQIHPNSINFERDDETVTLELDYRTQTPPNPRDRKRR